MFILLKSGIMAYFIIFDYDLNLTIIDELVGEEGRIEPLIRL